jgi:hypothetical protein
MSPASNAEAGPSNPVIIEIDEDENLDEQTKAAIENERINEVSAHNDRKSVDVCAHQLIYRSTKSGKRTLRSCMTSFLLMP